MELEAQLLFALLLFGPPWQHHLPPEAPAATLHHFRAVAGHEVGEGLRTKASKKNASRDAHAFIARWGLTWRIPFSYLDFEVDGGREKMPFISPKTFITFLIEKAPELLLGGCPDASLGRQHLRAFWRQYSEVHPTHRLFNEFHEERRLDNTFALALHGDEGRGLKKGNTTVVSMETCIGVNTWANMCSDRHYHDCSECNAGAATKRKFPAGTDVTSMLDELAGFQATNLKEHSFLTKFVLGVIPRKDKAIVEELLLHITRDFCSLFNEGILSPSGERWFGAIVGCKGDMKWHVQWGNLTRCFSKQLATNTAMCHECKAGLVEFPFEDGSDNPAFGCTTYSERPWEVKPVVAHIPFEKLGNDDAQVPHERIFRRDIFHNTKMGTFRDFIGSSVLVLCRLKYFNLAGEHNDRDTLLNRAYMHFRLFCQTTHRCPSLRSFTPVFFNAPNWSTFPWVNCKGSDTSHLLAWIQVMVSGMLNSPLKQDDVLLLRYIRNTASHARSMLRMTYSHGLWPSKKCGLALYESMHGFLCGFNSCSFLALNKHQCCAFAMKSKYHMIAHEKLDLRNTLASSGCTATMNCQVFGCEMCEDIIGKLSRLSRRVSTRTTALRTLQLYLTKSKAVYRRFKASNPKKLGVRAAHLKCKHPL